jgi:hypothetical protein
MGKVLALAGILIVVGALVVWKFSGKSETDGRVAPSDTKGTTGTDMQASEKNVSTKAVYKNPAGEDEVGFALTVNTDGTIVSATAQVLATHDISKKRQEAFAAEFPAALRGKKLSELSAIDRVGGSSLTTAAFNQALPELQAEL